MNIPKCKAWDQTNKEWVTYGFCLRFDADSNGEVLNAFAEPFKDRIVIPVFGTGLQDRTGKDIYAGDIIRTNNEQEGDEPSENHFYGVVVYDDQRTGYFIKQPHDKYSPALYNYYIASIEVIGNIWENSDLLLQEQ